MFPISQVYVAVLFRVFTKSYRRFLSPAFSPLACSRSTHRVPKVNAHSEDCAETRRGHPSFPPFRERRLSSILLPFLTHRIDVTPFDTELKKHYVQLICWTVGFIHIWVKLGGGPADGVLWEVRDRVSPVVPDVDQKHCMDEHAVLFNRTQFFGPRFIRINGHLECNEKRNQWIRQGYTHSVPVMYSIGSLNKPREKFNVSFQVQQLCNLCRWCLLEA